MTEREITETALKISERLYSHFGDKGSVKLMAMEYEDVIKIILEDYEIKRK